MTKDCLHCKLEDFCNEKQENCQKWEKKDFEQWRKKADKWLVGSISQGITLSLKNYLQVTDEDIQEDEDLECILS